MLAQFSYQRSRIAGDDPNSLSSSPLLSSSSTAVEYRNTPLERATRLSASFAAAAARDPLALAADGAVIEFDVVERRTIPRPVLAHDPLLKRPEPHLVVVVAVQRAVQRVVERLRVGTLKGESVGLVARVLVVGGPVNLPRRARLLGVQVEDGIAEAARGTHHGHGAVPHGDHLRQAAGLKHRRYQDEIRGGVHDVGQGLVEREAERRVRSAHVTRHRVKVSLHAGIGRGAEEDKLRAALDAVADGVLDEVETLLRGEARHDSHHGLVGAPGETETGLEGLAGGALAGLVVVGVVVHGEELVSLGVPNLGVDAVAHAVELVEVLVHRGVAGNLAGVRG
mmetsp:Transcript_6970/g.27393  ORF Transcript_6970/g.27393 Transcript_6970/m.27393 type:complete len:338 (-) Transcript_6970:521-1534(-)